MSSEILALAEILASHYKEVEAKDKRIAELEKELKLKLVIHHNYKAYELEQQAKGIESVINNGDYVSNNWLRYEVIQLRNQSKELKGQG